MTLDNAFWRFNIFGNIRKLGVISDHLGEHQIIKPYAFYLRLLNHANALLRTKPNKKNKNTAILDVYTIMEKRNNTNMLSSLFKVFVKSKNKSLTDNAVKYLAKILSSRSRMNNREAFDRIYNYKIWSNPLKKLQKLSVFGLKK